MLPLNTFKRTVLKSHFYPCDPQMTFDPMIITWDMFCLIGDEIQLNLNKVRQSYTLSKQNGD